MSYYWTSFRGKQDISLFYCAPQFAFAFSKAVAFVTATSQSDGAEFTFVIYTNLFKVVASGTKSIYRAYLTIALFAHPWYKIKGCIELFWVNFDLGLVFNMVIFVVKLSQNHVKRLVGVLVFGVF